jgi:hypothetical protein
MCDTSFAWGTFSPSAVVRPVAGLVPADPARLVETQVYWESHCIEDGFRWSGFKKVSERTYLGVRNIMGNSAVHQLNQFLLLFLFCILCLFFFLQ